MRTHFLVLRRSWLALAGITALVGAAGCSAGFPFLCDPAEEAAALAEPPQVARYTELGGQFPTKAPGLRRTPPVVEKNVAPVQFIQPAPPQPALTLAKAVEAPPPELVPMGQAAIERPEIEGGPTLDLDLGSAIGIASGQNPQIQVALARIQQAYAERSAARSLWLPSLRLGVSYNRHDGVYQASSGQALDVNRSSLNTGAGVGAVGTGAVPFPGLGANFKANDAIFRPRIADRELAASQFAATTATNETMLGAALAYLELMRAYGQYAIALETQEDARELADLTRSFADSGEGLQADADRAQVELALRENDVQRTLEAIDTASARLAQQLSVDPTLRITPQEPTVVPIDLVSLEMPTNELVATGLSRRPELAEAGNLVQAAALELRRERVAPLLPSVLLGFSYGGFGGGLGASGAADDFGERLDYNAIAYWEVRNFGFGEDAARKSAGARTRQARWRQMRLLDQVATEVAESHAQVRARAAQIDTAERGVTLAGDSYRRNMQRIRQGEGLPLEVLQSLQALDQMKREYLRTVVDYNIAQFRLQWAMGWPAG